MSETEKPAGEEQEAAATGEQPGGDQATPQDNQTGTPPWAEKRFAELSAQKNHAREQAERERARADAAERELEQYRANTNGIHQSSEPAMPSLESLDYDEEKYAAAMGQYYAQLSERSVQQALTAHQQQQQEQAQQAAAQKQQAELVARFGESENSFRATHPDYDEVARNPNLPLTQNVVDVLLRAADPAAIAYHIGKNPQLAAKLGSMDQLSIAREIGQIEARLTPNTVSNAPPPIAPPSGGEGAPSGDPNKMSTEDWMRWRNAQLGRG